MDVVEEIQLKDSFCGCCGNVIRNYCGHIVESGNVVSNYWLRIPEGHPGFYTLGIAIDKDSNPRGAVLIGKADETGKSYTIQNTDNSPWSDFGEYGRILEREQVLADPSKALIFSLCDCIASQDSRLVPYVNKHHGIT